MVEPGFPVGVGGGHRPHWGHQPLTWALFGRNICENERIGSRGEAARWQWSMDPPLVKKRYISICDTKSL